jgi:hypothetical protein
MGLNAAEMCGARIEWTHDGIRLRAALTGAERNRAGLTHWILGRPDSPLKPDWHASDYIAGLLQSRRTRAHRLSADLMCWSRNSNGDD